MSRISWGRPHVQMEELVAYWERDDIRLSEFVALSKTSGRRSMLKPASRHRLTLDGGGRTRSMTHCPSYPIRRWRQRLRELLDSV